MKKIMKKLMIVAVVVLAVMMTLPAMACEVGLDGSTYDQEETYYIEGSSYYEDDESSDLCEVYAGNPNVAIVANEDGEEGACYTGGAYTKGVDGFKPDEEFMGVCDALGTYPDGSGIIGIEGTMWCQPINIEDIPAIPYGGDPTPQREWANEQIWEATGE